jgi:hypothetical protein
MQNVSPNRSGLIELYCAAQQLVVEAGYAQEITAQRQVSFRDVTETDFLQESAWVILNCGMRERTIRRKFPLVSSAFLEWKSAEAIIKLRPECRKAALSCFSHQGKIDAILEVIDHVATNGFPHVKESIKKTGTTYLQRFAFIGPITCLHLAKNLGLDVVKPDRHLLRMAAAAGFISPEALCRTIAEAMGEKLSVIDIVLWRFATLDRDYLSLFDRYCVGNRATTERTMDITQSAMIPGAVPANPRLGAT